MGEVTPPPSTAPPPGWSNSPLPVSIIAFAGTVCRGCLCSGRLPSILEALHLLPALSDAQSLQKVPKTTFCKSQKVFSSCFRRPKPQKCDFLYILSPFGACPVVPLEACTLSTLCRLCVRSVGAFYL